MITVIRRPNTRKSYPETFVIDNFMEIHHWISRRIDRGKSLGRNFHNTRFTWKFKVMWGVPFGSIEKSKPVEPMANTLERCYSHVGHGTIQLITLFCSIVLPRDDFLFSTSAFLILVRARHTYFIWQASMMQASCGRIQTSRVVFTFPDTRTCERQYGLRMTNRLATL